MSLIVRPHPISVREIFTVNEAESYAVRASEGQYRPERCACTVRYHRGIWCRGRCETFPFSMLGGNKTLPPDKRQLAVHLYQEKKVAVKQICALMGISKPTLYAYVRQAQEARQRG